MNLLRTALVALTLSVAGTNLHAQESGIAVGSRAPGAQVQTLTGQKTDLASYIGKTPVVIEFWASWCSSCKELEPKFLALQKKYGSKVRFLGVAVSVSQSRDRVRAYTARHKYRHETLFDSDGKAVDAYEVPATSYIVIVDAKGTVVYTGLGGKQDIEAAILKAL